MRNYSPLAKQIVCFTLFLCVVIVGCLPNYVQGSTQDMFTVQTLIGQDTTPPSVPASVSVVPIATTQINVTWATSTDDFAVGGYRIYRNDLLVGTTTASAFSDVGLTPSTTYTYYVTAFDIFGNTSASSTEVSTSTLAVSIDSPETGVSYGSKTSRFSLEVIRLEVIPDTRSVRIYYETKGYIRSVIRWGSGSEYELGSTAERTFVQTHETVLYDLMPDTEYSFIIEGENAFGKRGILVERTIRTLPEVGGNYASNVTGLSAFWNGTDIELAWTNPPDPAFDRVRIQRSDLFYPRDAADGWMIYEGQGTRARDTGAGLVPGPLYYTVFTYDTSGNMSSGAVVRVVRPGDTTSAGGGSDWNYPTTTDDVPVYTPYGDIQLGDVYVIQEGVHIPFVDRVAVIDGARHVQIDLPYERFPKHLKILRFSIPREDDGYLVDVLLRVNNDYTAYTAQLPPLGSAGDYPFRITMMDFDTNGIYYLYGVLRAELITEPYTSPESGFRAVFSKSIAWLLLTLEQYAYLIICAALLLLVGVAYRFRRGSGK